MLLNRLINPPQPANSSEMRAYMAAILEVTGMMSGQGFALRSFLNHLATHLKPKVSFPHATLREGANSLIYVTEPGLRFFASRLTTSPMIKGQYVQRSDVIQMIRHIVASAPASGWEQVDAKLEEELL